MNAPVLVKTAVLGGVDVVSFARCAAGLVGHRASDSRAFDHALAKIVKALVIGRDEIMKVMFRAKHGAAVERLLRRAKRET